MQITLNNLTYSDYSNAVLLIEYDKSGASFLHRGIEYYISYNEWEFTESHTTYGRPMTHAGGHDGYEYINTPDFYDVTTKQDIIDYINRNQKYWEEVIP